VNQFDGLIEIDFPAKSRDVNVNDVVQRRTSGRFFPNFPR
jgi:hypothetical protein